MIEAQGRASCWCGLVLWVVVGVSCGGSPPSAGVDGGVNLDAGGGAPLEDAGAVTDADEGGQGSDAGANTDAGDEVGEGVDAALVDAALLDDGGDDGGAEVDVGCGLGECLEPGQELLALEAGLFLEVRGEGDEPERVVRFGEVGVQYSRIAVSFEVEHGGWREDAFDRGVLNHNLVGLFRNAPRSHQRYLLGLGAQIRSPPRAMDPMALLYGRVDLEERPQGEGYTGYQTFRRGYGWQEGRRHRAELVLDAAGRAQSLELGSGEEGVRVEGEIPYMNEGLTASGFYLEFGGEETAYRDVKARGWRFFDLVVTGWR